MRNHVYEKARNDAWEARENVIQERRKMPSAGTFACIGFVITIPLTVVGGYFLFQSLPLEAAALIFLFGLIVWLPLCTGAVWGILAILVFLALAVRYYPYILFPALASAGGFFYLATLFLQSNNGLVFLFGLFGMLSVIIGGIIIGGRFRWS